MGLGNLLAISNPTLRLARAVTLLQGFPRAPPCLLETPRVLTWSSRWDVG